MHGKCFTTFHIFLMGNLNMHSVEKKVIKNLKIQVYRS